MSALLTFVNLTGRKHDAWMDKQVCHFRDNRSVTFYLKLNLRFACWGKKNPQHIIWLLITCSNEELSQFKLSRRCHVLHWSYSENASNVSRLLFSSLSQNGKSQQTLPNTLWWHHFESKCEEAFIGFDSQNGTENKSCWHELVTQRHSNYSKWVNVNSTVNFSSGLCYVCHSFFILKFHIVKF